MFPGFARTSSSNEASQARQLLRTSPTQNKVAPPNHSTGRALARLPLLILIHPPLREAEWRCSSGGGRAAPYGVAGHIERRSSRSRP
ncbi:hypothetical protein C1Y08_04445 [Pseudomonas sp. FW306-02-F02-AA]|nr:hypothetical protein C1Y07_29685 [Pseudomonas sp. FW306-02-F02-AB]PMZ10986.1 hypothetical protein C1Y06_04760 [Pseudomonas sp. FW306-02-H06C]PMZ16941.1 hypothetical protein C1Y08_04445 [Pseudomonas sp. FW306-02-F02-AA]PMZ23186.1 hypothetical protein C1Y09_03050 [Pseudomonas sp. FW306-02-F08-AA]PMZ29015.1 hypothetical protein C1Y05_03455 [Pseudomonas sp. FW306-02-F04-BA]PMZ36353.1 hypothetical protein C1X99_00095 [Pseudomonas sp. FW306-02-H06B]PMZ41119.1 hypothetical protein C1Y00_06970 [Ps